MPILCALAFCFLFQKAEAAKPVIDNERVAVFDVTMTKGKAIPAQTDFDTVKVYLAGGAIKTTQPGGKSSVVMRNAGDAVFEAKGTSAGEELISGGAPAREIIIELKDHKAEPVPNTSGYPNAFPRAGSKSLIDNERVAVWDYSWQPGVPTVMHFHDKDVVVIYFEDGILRSVAPDGKIVDNNYSAGAIRFNFGNRAHSEELISGAQRAIITEFK